METIFETTESGTTYAVIYRGGQFPYTVETKCPTESGSMSGLKGEVGRAMIYFRFPPSIQTAALAALATFNPPDST